MKIRLTTRRHTARRIGQAVGFGLPPVDCCRRTIGCKLRRSDTHFDREKTSQAGFGFDLDRLGRLWRRDPFGLGPAGETSCF